MHYRMRKLRNVFWFSFYQCLSEFICGMPTKSAAVRFHTSGGIAESMSALLGKVAFHLWLVLISPTVHKLPRF